MFNEKKAYVERTILTKMQKMSEIKCMIEGEIEPKKIRLEK